jgi:transcriptional regulator with XRE-family HTH domain
VVTHGQVDIGARIKEAREEIGLSQLALAKELEVGERTVQAWEANDRTPRLGALQRLALRTRKPVTFFYGNGDKAA